MPSCPHRRCLFLVCTKHMIFCACQPRAVNDLLELFAVVCLQDELSPGATTLQCVKVDVAGGPVFSLQRGVTPKIVDPNVKMSKPVVYLGLAAKEITAWQPDQLTFNDKVGGWYVSSRCVMLLPFCSDNRLAVWEQQSFITSLVLAVLGVCKGGGGSKLCMDMLCQSTLEPFVCCQPQLLHGVQQP